MIWTVSSGDPGASTSPPVADPQRPVGEPAARVTGSHDQAGTDHHGRRGAVEHRLLAGHLHRPVRLHVLAQVDVLGDRLELRRRPRGAARHRVVGIDADRRHEDPVRAGQRGDRRADPRGVTGDVDDGVERRGGQLSRCRLVAVPDQVGRAGRDGARLTAARTGHVVAAAHRLLGDRLGQEQGAAEHEEPHASTQHDVHDRGQAIQPRADRPSRRRSRTGWSLGPVGPGWAPAGLNVETQAFRVRSRRSS